MQPDVELIIASDAATREAVYRFRQDVARVSCRPVDVLPGTDDIHAETGLRDLLDPFAIVAAAIDKDSQAIVGAARTNFLRDGAIPFYPELYGLRELSSSIWFSSSVTSCWTMAPAFECASASALSHPAMLLAWTLYDVALRERICHDFLDCRDDDVSFFLTLGYRHVRVIEHPTRGRSNLMRLDIYDWLYLAQIRSPFLTLARGAAS